jgi:NAD(P) transhydrogenase
LYSDKEEPENLCSATENDELCIEDRLSSAGVNFDPKSLASNPFAFPTGVWSSPEAAYYGLSKQQAQNLGIEAGEGIALYCQCLRGLVFDSNGILKIVFEKATGIILGVHICGNDACEIIHYGMELVKGRKTLQTLTENLYSAGK